MNHIRLDKIKPEFRYLVDLLFFTDRMDIDTSNFYNLLQENRTEHLTYLIDHINKSSNICWLDAESFWENRISLLLSFNDKFISKYTDHYFEKRMFSIIRSKREINERNDLEYLQFLVYCKVKNIRKDNLLSLKTSFIELSPQVRIDKLIKIIYSLIPNLFRDIDDYVNLLAKNITYEARNFEILQSLENHDVIFDKKSIVQLAQDIMLKRARSVRNIKAFFAIINDPVMLKQLKSEYKVEYRENLVNLISNCDYMQLEEYFFKNIKNVLELDSVIADDVAEIYASKLYARKFNHKRANADRLIRLMKTFSQISHKKVLVYLSNNNKMKDIKYLLKAFPDLRKLAAFA